MAAVLVEIDKQITTLLDEAYACRTNNLKQSTLLATEALMLSKDADNKPLIAKSLNQLALYAMIQGQYDNSITMSNEALAHFNQLNDERGIADAKYNIAGVYYKTDNYHLGLVYLIDCLATYHSLNDHHNLARVEKSLGTIYEYFGDQKNAVKSYENSIEAAQKAGDTDLESNAYNPLSSIYLKLGEVDKALEIIERSVSMKKQTGDIRGLAFALYGRGKIHIKTKNYNEAEKDLEHAITIHTKMGEKLGLGMAYCKLGALYVEIGEYEKAKAVLFSGLELSEQYNIVIVKFKCNYLYYRIYKLENNPVCSLEYLERYLEQKEGVINTQTLKVIENYELISKMELVQNEARMQSEKAEIIDKKNRAEQAALVKQEFLSTMSHEIRTPLNAVITIASLLADKTTKGERQLVKSLKFAANNLLLLINDILDFTKLDTGKAYLELRPTNFSKLLENIKNTYENLAKEKGLELFLKINFDVAEAYATDETKLSQIIGNLVTNAIKFTETGQVEIKIEKLDSNADVDTLKFCVIDSGTGIANNHLESIFDSFSQPKSITTRKEGGSGLGLAIVKRLVELYGGIIEVKSTVGKGSVFCFEIKLQKSVNPSKVPMFHSDLLRDKTVLLAEDNKINAMVAMKLLSNWKMKAEHATNGIEAVEKAASKAYDFILMDIHMPDMDGFTATKSIRAAKGFNASAPIFALTADVTAEHMEEYLNYFNGFLSKPIEINKLFEAMVNEL